LPPSFEEYVHARGPDLLRFAYVLCGDYHLAQDLVQEVLAKAYRRWSHIESASPDPYLRKGIVRTHLSWRMRRAGRETIVEHTPDRPAGADFSTRHAARDELWALLATLSKTQRAVLVLRFFEDLDDTQISELVGCAEATVRVHAHRGLAKRRERMLAQAGLPDSTVGATQ
jgi:RNA polymerase sigma-70 factor (sigma-E family)